MAILAFATIIATTVGWTPTSLADTGPSTYRAIALSAADRAEHGDEVLHAFVDAYYAGKPLHHWSEAHPDTLAEHGHEAVHAWIVGYWEQQWIAAYERNEAARVAAEKAEQARRATGGAYVHGIEVCNGRDLPPCRVVRRESGFNPSARNPSSTAWGLYQFLRGTWNGVCPEYPHGSATVAQQVECARRLWAGGRGASHWALTL